MRQEPFNLYWFLEGIDTGAKGVQKMLKEELWPHCKFCNSSHVVRNGTRRGTQYWLCKSCGKGFVDNLALPRGKYPMGAVASALQQYFTGSSLNDIRRHTEQHYKTLPSDSTVYAWVRKYTEVAQEAIKDLRPQVGEEWIADETVIKISGRKYWLWDIIDSKTRFLLAAHLSPNRGTREARKLMELASERAGKAPRVVVTDRLASYIDGIEIAFGSDTKHVQASPFSGTQKIERWHGTLKERTKVVWGLKKPETARQFLKGFLFFYNFLRPHESLNDKTPAEVAGISVPFRDWLDVVKSQSPLSERQRVSVPTMAQPYRKRSKRPKTKRKSKRNRKITSVAGVGTLRRR